MDKTSIIKNQRGSTFVWAGWALPTFSNSQSDSVCPKTCSPTFSGVLLLSSHPF